MIGRLFCALFIVGTLGLGSANAVSAAPSPATAASAAPGPTMSASAAPSPTTSVSPAPSPATKPATKVKWQRNGLVTWERLEHRSIAPTTIHRLMLSLAPAHSEVIAHGSSGIVEQSVRYAQRDGGPIRRTVLASAVIKPAKPRIVAVGIGGTPLASFEARGIAAMAYMARNAIEMIATGYTADCIGCGGMTAIGRRAGHGIVAVDPRVIPIGTHLYIPGYGLAIAGDTGGDIVGNRIDLGFDSIRDAMNFGRRDIKVYRLR